MEEFLQNGGTGVPPSVSGSMPSDGLASLPSPCVYQKHTFGLLGGKIKFRKQNILAAEVVDYLAMVQLS